MMNTQGTHLRRNIGQRGLVLSAAVLVLATSMAHAQRLNLDAPSAPAPGSNESTRAIKASLGGAAAGNAGEPLPDSELGALARARTQALALALVTRGEELGEAGSVHVVAAMTLLADMGWMSELGVRAVQDGGEDAAAALRAYVRAVDALGLNGAAGAGKLPEAAAELDVLLRGVFAPLTEMLRPEGSPLKSGWVAADAARASPTVAELRASIQGANAESPDDATRAAVLDLLGALEEAEASWSFAAAALDARATLAGALPVTIDGLPGWFPEMRRAQMLERVSAALRAFSATTRDDDAAAILVIAASTVRVCAWADGLERSAGQNARDVQSVRLAVADAAAEAVGESGTARERARKAMRALERTLDLIDERPVLGTDADVQRELKTSFRALDSAAKRSEAQLVAQIAEIARAESASSQPAIVSAIASHRRALDDLKMLRMVDGLLAKRKDDKSPSWRLVESRLIRVGQEVSKPATMETALLDLRAFAAAMELQEPFAGEPVIRAAAKGGAGGAIDSWDETAIKELTGNKAAAVMARIDELRTAYLEAWAREGDDRTEGGAAGARPGAAKPGAGGRPEGGQSAEDSEAIASRLRVLRMLCGFVEDIRAVRALGVPEHRVQREGLLAWRGLPISASAAAWLGGGEGMSRLVSEAATQALDQSPAAVDRARTAIRRLEAGNLALRLIARLNREARERGIVAVPPFASLAAPPTRGAWMAGERAKLAVIARYVDEAAAAAEAGNDRDAGKIMAYVEMVAGEIPE